MNADHEIAVDLTRRKVVAFCEEFLKDPYYRAGQHARFACQLYHAIHKEERYQLVGGHRMSEYPRQDSNLRPPV